MNIYIYIYTLVLVKSIDTINLGSSIKIFEEKSLRKCSSINEFEVNNHQITMENDTLLAQNNGNTVSDANINSNEKYVFIFKLIN